MPSGSTPFALSLSALAAAALASNPARGQCAFSIDFQSPMIGVPNSFSGAPISEGDILFPAPGMPAPGPLPPPGIVLYAGVNPIAPDLGLPMYVFGGPFFTGMPSMVEVDAISFGNDLAVAPAPMPNQIYTYSVDEFAVGIPPVPAPNTIAMQGAAAAMEASADVFMSFPPGMLPPGPLPPFASPGGNTLLFDGNGIPAPFMPPVPPIPGLLGLGLVEPNPPTPGMTMDMGDNLDALDVDTIGATAALFPVFFSLDSGFPDPLEGPPANSASAPANGFLSGAAVLVKVAPLAPTIGYAFPALLGLDLMGPPSSDDLDALAIAENGIPGYQPSMMPYDWMVPGGPDMLLFSVRRGSAIVGAPDSFFGIPIMEGDILTTPLAGGASPFPAIFIAAENLGLATMRATPGLLLFPPFSDDLDALDVSPDCNGDAVPDVFTIAWGVDTDCNGNAQPDSCDIMMGAADCNGNGVPDSCEIASGVLSDCDGDGIPGVCECPADISPASGDCVVNVNDLLLVIGSWGGSGVADINGDGVVNVNDLLAVIGAWGGCP